MAWQRVDLVVDGGVADAEPLAEALESQGALSTELSDADAGTPRERAVFAEPGSDAPLWPRCRVSALFALDARVALAVDGAVAACAIDSAAAAFIDRVEDADWVALPQRQFEPIRAGARLWI